ncbi:MAG: hypothetical protein ABH851_02915 [Methanobacteriota archaeon]
MARKKKISSWKQKKTYNVLAPDSFNNKILGVTLSADPKNLIGRTITISAKDLTEDRTKQHFNLTFEVTDVSGEGAKTKFKKFTVSSGYMKSKVRKKTTKIDFISEASFEGVKTRVKVMISGGRGISRDQKKQISEKIKSIFNSHKDKKIDDVVQMIVFGKLGTEIYHGLKTINQIYRVEIQQLKVV